MSEDCVVVRAMPRGSPAGAGPGLDGRGASGLSCFCWLGSKSECISLNKVLCPFSVLRGESETRGGRVLYLRCGSEKGSNGVGGEAESWAEDGEE